MYQSLGPIASRGLCTSPLVQLLLEGPIASRRLCTSLLVQLIIEGFVPVSLREPLVTCNFLGGGGSGPPFSHFASAHENELDNLLSSKLGNHLSRYAVN